MFARVGARKHFLQLSRERIEPKFAPQAQKVVEKRPGADIDPLQISLAWNVFGFSFLREQLVDVEIFRIDDAELEFFIG